MAEYNSKRMKNLISQILVILLLVFSISAQENQPVLFDEFGKLYNDDLLARIYGLSIEADKIPNSKALVQISGGNDNYFAPYILGSSIKSGWKNNIKQPAEKLLIQFCDVNEGTFNTRFFIVRENDKVETCNENLIIPKQTVRVENVSYIDYGLTPRTVFDSIEDTYLSTDSSPVQYSEFALSVLKRFLKESPESRLYVIAYLQTNFEEDENGKIIVGSSRSLDKKSYAANMFRAARDKLIKKGFSPSQIITIDGGYVNNWGRRLEFWFVPKSGEIPKPKPDYIQKKIGKLK